MDVRAQGPAADALRDYLAAAGVTIGPGEGAAVVSSAAILEPAGREPSRFVLSDSGFAASPGRPCGACLAALLAAQPAVAREDRPAAALAAGSLAAAELLLALARPGSREPVAFSVWPTARNLPPPECTHG